MTGLKSHFRRPQDGLELLSKKLGYTFGSLVLPISALTHRSYDSKNSYERLEFLGDALLGAIIGEYLYHTYADLDEGRLTRMRATMVRQETLAIVAERLELHRHVILGAGERKGGGYHRASLLADVVEALIGAIYLDSGDFAVVQRCVLSWYDDVLKTVSADTMLKDAKSRLQEYLQANKLSLPVYELLDTQGNPPNQTFFVRCTVGKEGIAPITEHANSRRIAEQKCAERMINQLNLFAQSPN